MFRLVLLQTSARGSPITYWKQKRRKHETSIKCNELKYKYGINIIITAITEAVYKTDGPQVALDKSGVKDCQDKGLYSEHDQYKYYVLLFLAFSRH